MNNNNPAQRIAAIDMLRGLVMILMALDHARDFWGGYTPVPTNLDETTVPLFLTRWVTHFCAPVFVFLAGTSAWLYGSKRSPAELARFLFSRGAWLILLELTICKYVWIPEPGYSVVLIQIIWVIGWSMIALSVLCFLGPRVVVAIGLVIVVGHNLLDPLVPEDFGRGYALWVLLHERGAVGLGEGLRWIVSYPLLPWIGVIALGYGFGATVSFEPARRRRLYLQLGLGMTAAFVLLRLFNIYGDPVAWTTQESTAFSILSFLNTNKYPPSLLFLLMTLGPSLCLLAVFDRWPAGWLREALLVYGRVPLFFYVLHLYLLRFTAIPVSISLYGAEAVRPPPGPAGSAMLGLAGTYAAWVIALLLLYPACRWFGRVKQRRRDWWLSYL